jgi:serine/threonine protein phosphatase PrpC
VTISAASLIVGVACDVGSVRERNEDSVLVEPPDSPDAQAYGWLGIVADGLGGHRRGDVASALAVQTTRNVFYTLGPRAADVAPRLRSAVEHANDAIRRKGDEGEEFTETASTITAAVIVGSKLSVAQVGDSRGYLIRNSRLRQITQDHSLVDELVRKGNITREEAQHHPNRNVITRALGTRSTVEVDLFEESLLDNDVVLLCSDGLYRVVDESEMARALIAEPQPAADSLIALANQRGAPDNVSVIIIRISLPTDSGAAVEDEITAPQHLRVADDGETTLIRPR